MPVGPHLPSRRGPVIATPAPQAHMEAHGEAYVNGTVEEQAAPQALQELQAAVQDVHAMPVVVGAYQDALAEQVGCLLLASPAAGLAWIGTLGQLGSWNGTPGPLLAPGRG